MKAKEFIPAEKPRNFVAKNAKMGGAGQHKDKKKSEKQGDSKHKKPFMEGAVKELVYDIKNMSDKPLFLERTDLPEVFDFVFLDGGEFTTYYEFQKLFSRCVKFIALDDVHTPKCMKIRNILQAHPDWKELIYNNERHGFSLFLKSP